MELIDEYRTIKISYKQLYTIEKKKRENLDKVIEEQKREIDKLNKLLDVKTAEIKYSKKYILSYKNSETAKNGYKEENLVCEDLKNESIIRKFSSILGDNYDECYRISNNSKCDIQSNNNKLRAQVKKYKKDQFQQLDRHWIDDLIKKIPELTNISQILKDLFEYPILFNGTHIDKSHTIKKLCISNYSQDILTKFLLLLNKHKGLILNYAFLGSISEIQPEYLFGVEYNGSKRTKITLFKIKDIIDYLETLNFKITKRKTVVGLGEDSVMSIQRKGGDGGKKSSNQLQIKIIVSKLIGKISCIQHVL